MNGSIRSREPHKPNSRCRKWQLVLEVGTDNLTGKRKRKTRAFQGTYRQAEAALQEFAREVEGSNLNASTCTLGAYYKDWHEARALSGDYSQRTIEGEDYKMRNVLKYLGNVSFADLTPKDFERVYIKLRQGGTVSGKPYSGTSCANTHKVVVTLLKAAERDRLIPVGFSSSIKPPKNDTKEKQALELSQINTLLDSLNPEYSMHMLVMLCVLCGLRRSEALALTWNDLDGGSIRINKTLNEDCTIKDCPKTKAGYRYVPMPEQVQAALTVRQAVQGMVIGDRQTDNTPIIDNLGEYYAPHSASSWWRVHREEFGVTCSLHELRHTYTTLLIQSNVDVRTVQALLGHASPDVTLEVYAHVHDEQRKKAVQSLGELLG